MSSTAGGGGGGAGATGLGLAAGFADPPDFFFEGEEAAGLVAAGLFVAGAVACASAGSAPNIRHANAQTAIEGRDGKASMGAILLTGAHARTGYDYQRVSTVNRSVRGSTGWKWRSCTGVASPGSWLS